MRNYIGKLEENLLYNDLVNHTSIIIVHYNTDHDTDECLLSLDEIKTGGKKVAVIVVDNGSQEPYSLPKEVANRAPQAQRQFIVVRSESNLGFTGGNNLGIHFAIEKYNSDAILLLNSDTTVDKDVLVSLQEFSDEHPTVGIVSPKIYFSPGREYHSTQYTNEDFGKVIWYAGGSIDWQHLISFHRGVDEVDRGHFDNQFHSDFATGCAMYIQREVLEKVGTFDKRFFLYLEDVDLSVRAKLLGYEIGFSPKSIVYHKNASSGDGVGNSLQNYYQTRNRLLFAFKHGNWYAKLTALRLSFYDLLDGSSAKKTAILHALTQKFGKQQIV